MKQSITDYIIKIATPTKVLIGAMVTIVSAGSALGMWVYNKGKADAKKEVKEISYEGKIDGLIVSFDSLRQDVKALLFSQVEIEKNQSDHLLYEEKQEARFKTLEGSYTSLLPLINRLDVYVKYLEDTKSENEKKK
jgi:hypothetical protein